MAGTNERSKTKAQSESAVDVVSTEETVKDSGRKGSGPVEAKEPKTLTELLAIEREKEIERHRKAIALQKKLERGSKE